MAKRTSKGKNRNQVNQRRGRQHQSARNQRAAKPAASRPEELIAAEYEDASTVAQAEGLDMPQVGDEPKPADADPDALWRMVRGTRDVYIELRNLLDGRTQELDARAAQLEEQERSNTARAEELSARESEAAKRRTTLDQRDASISELERTLADRETEIHQRELNAEQGFVKERREMLSQLDDEVASFRAEFLGRWQEGQALLHKRQEELDEREILLTDERREVAGAKRKLGYESQDLEELRAHLGERAEQQAAAIREELEHHIKSLEAQLGQARHDRDAHRERLRHREDADRRFGQRKPEEVMAALDALRTENETLRSELAERPDADAAGRLAVLEGERDVWQTERMELRREAAEHQARLKRANINVIERESQRDEIESLKAARELLRKSNEELRAEVGDLLDRSQASTPFPACTSMDQDPEFQTGHPLHTEAVDLEGFVEDLQQRIASTGPGQEPLFYSLADLRSFIAGLAMGRLILLQGISGTGKTSLPVAFARAVGTSAAEIRVQAGWRDPQDLIGHYNTFEKRFHETEFLKALYRAGTPRWEDTIQVILLDEMNLSHPEQYFSDLLSTLEPAADQRLELMTHSMAAAPALLDGAGKLRIPSNVWFVGTANHDETTMGFAPKTYDRSHVMEFPSRPAPFDVQKVGARSPISFNGLQEAFEQATDSHGRHVEHAIEFLDSRVRDSLADGFDIGWGPRLERQMHRYVPVVIAAGGTVGEATDHMLAMRVLRKLGDRHDIRPERVADLKERIRESWPVFDRKSEPVKSLMQLDSQLKRLGRNPENDG